MGRAWREVNIFSYSSYSYCAQLYTILTSVSGYWIISSSDLNFRGLALSLTAIFKNTQTLKFKTRLYNCAFSLPSIIIRFTSNEPWNKKTHKTNRNPPVTNHKPWPFEPIKKVPFPKRSAKMSDGNENRKPQLTFELKNSRVFERRGKWPKDLPPFRILSRLSLMLVLDQSFMSSLLSLFLSSPFFLPPNHNMTKASKQYLRPGRFGAL